MFEYDLERVGEESVLIFNDDVHAVIYRLRCTTDQFEYLSKHEYSTLRGIEHVLVYDLDKVSRPILFIDSEVEFYEYDSDAYLVMTSADAPMLGEGQLVAVVPLEQPAQE